MRTTRGVPPANGLFDDGERSGRIVNAEDDGDRSTNVAALSFISCDWLWLRVSFPDEGDFFSSTLVVARAFSLKT